MGEKLVIFGETFINFLVNSTLDGKINQVILRQIDEGYEINVMSETVINVCGLLHKKNFIMYSKLGDIVIKDVKRLIRLVKGMKGNISMEIIKNKLLINGETNEIEYGLASEEYVENNPKEKLPIEFDSGFIMDKNLLVEIKSKADLLKVGKCNVEVTNNILRIMVEEVDKFIVKSEVAYGNVNGSFGLWLMDIAGFLEDKVNVSLQNDFPIRIISKNDTMIIKYIIAPIVKVDGKEKSESEDNKEEENKSG